MVSQKPPADNRKRQGTTPTLVDVAREANVSVSTAGRALRDSDWPLDLALKERVLIAARKLSYVPNMAARTLRAGGPALVGLVSGNMLDPYYGEIAETVTRHAEASHMMLAMVCNMQRDPVLELKYCRLLWEHRVAGLILAGGGFDQSTHQEEFASTLKQMTNSGVVVVTLSPRGIDAPMFCVDNYTVGQMAAAELIRHGHRNIGIVIGGVLNEVRKQRLRGMITAIDAAGANYYVAEPDSRNEPDTSATSLLIRHPEITAVIAGTHVISMGIINGVRRAGKSVPEDISIVAIGNVRLVEWNIPKLTYIDLNLEVCSQAALDYIAAKVGDRPCPDHTTSAPRLVAGNSVKTIARQTSRRSGKHQPKI